MWMQAAAVFSMLLRRGGLAVARAVAGMRGGKIFRDRLTQPVLVGRRIVGLAAAANSGFAEGVENREAQICAGTARLGEIVDVGVRLELEIVGTELFQLHAW